MSKISNKSMLNHSSISNHFRNNKVQSSKPTVFIALNKLKQEQDKVLLEHKRYQVLNRQISKQHINSINQQRKQYVYSIVRQSASQDKEAKKLSQEKKIEEIKVKYSINLKQRQENKNMINNVRKSFNNANHSMYEEIRKKKANNQNIIHFQKVKNLNNKMSARKLALEQEDSRRKSIQNFYQSRVQETKMKKTKEIEEMIRKSEERRRVYDFLSSRNSRVRMDKLSSSRVSSARNDQKNPQNNQTMSISK